MGVWSILRAVWNGPFYIGHLSQPVSVGDVLLKTLETAWRVVIALIGGVLAVVIAGVAWIDFLSPALFPPLSARISATAEYDDGTGPPPIYLGTQPPPKPAHCTADYPIKVTLYNQSSKPVGSITFNVAAHLPGYTANEIEYGGLHDLNRIIEPGMGWYSCWNLPQFKDSVDAKALLYEVKVSDAKSVADAISANE